MINGLGVVGWGVGGIEAEASMLGQPIYMLIPKVVGFELTGALTEGTTATDLVLTVTQMLREHGVVGKFVEFWGEGLDHLSLADRATIANMAPEYGATMGFFPIDQRTLDYLELSGRSDSPDRARREILQAPRPVARPLGPNHVLVQPLARPRPPCSRRWPAPSGPQDRILLSDMKGGWHLTMKESGPRDAPNRRRPHRPTRAIRPSRSETMATS